MKPIIAKVQQSQLRKDHPAFRPGDTVRVNLHFDDGDTQVVQFPVRPANAQGPAN